MMRAAKCFPNLSNETLLIHEKEYRPSEDNHDGGIDTLSRLAMFRRCSKNSGTYKKQTDLKTVLLFPFILLKWIGTLPSSLYMILVCLARKAKKGGYAAVIDPLLVNKTRDLFDTVIQEKFCSIWSGEVPEHLELEYVDRLDNLVQQPNMEGYHKLIKEFHEICISNYGNRLNIWIHTIEKVQCEWLRHKMLTVVRACLLQGHHETVIRALRLMCSNIPSLPIDDELANLLHLSIVNTDCELLNLLLHNIKPEDLYLLLNKPNVMTAKFDTLETFDLPLSIAVWVGNEEAVKRLVECGAEMLSKDRKGANVFHILVCLEGHIPESVENMYDQLISCINIWVTKTKQFAFLSSTEESQALLYAKWLLIRAKNDKGYTPLQLAARLGSVKVFKKLINTDNVYSFNYFSLGAFSERMYDISEIDPFFNCDKHNISVLEILGLCSTDKNRECLMVEPVLSLINDKWKNHQPAMLFWVIIHYLFMGCYSWKEYQDHFQTHFLRNQTNTTVSKFEFRCSDYMLFASTAWYIVLTSICLFVLSKSYFRLCLTVNQGVRSLNHLCTSITLLYTLFSLIYLLLKYLKLDGLYCFQALSILTGWILTQIGFRVFKRLSFFHVVFSHVLHGDATIYIFVLFNLCLAVTLASVPIMYGFLSDNLEFSSFTQTYMNFLRLGVGVADFNDLYMAGIKHNIFFLFFYICFIIIGNLLVLNMLIGSMSDSYSKLRNQQDILCIASKVGDIVLVEKILPLFTLYVSTSAHFHKVIRLHLPEGKTADRHVYLFPAKYVET